MTEAGNAMKGTVTGTELYRKLGTHKVTITFEFSEEGGVARWLGNGHIDGSRIGVFMWLKDLDQFKEQMEAYIQLLLDVQDDERKEEG